MNNEIDFSWLDRLPEAVEAKFGPVTRRVLAELRKLREKEGRPG